MTDIDTEYDSITNRDVIRDYIINHDDCMPVDVIKYMNGKLKEQPPIKAAMATTQKILKDMEREGTTIVTIDKKIDNTVVSTSMITMLSFTES